MKPSTSATLPSIGGVVAAAGSALCCAGLSAFEPWRPYMLGATALFLVTGFVLLDREERAACVPGKPCADQAV